MSSEKMEPLGKACVQPQQKSGPMRIVIEGPRGCGKTRTAIEIAKFLRERGCSVSLTGSNTQASRWLESISRRAVDKSLTGEVEVMDTGNGPKLAPPPPDARDGILYSSEMYPDFWKPFLNLLYGRRKR